MLKVVASSMSRRVPKPVAPLLSQPSSPSTAIGPAMSRCAHGTSPTNSDRKIAAVVAGERSAVGAVAVE